MREFTLQLWAVKLVLAQPAGYRPPVPATCSRAPNGALVEYTDRLPAIHVPTLITVGDHDERDPSLARTMHEEIAGSKLVVLPKSGHMTFVDQPNMFIHEVDEFLRARGTKLEAK